MSSCDEDNKSITLPVVLKGDNYITWARTVKTALGWKGLWKYVLETKTFEDSKGKAKEGEVQEAEEKWVQGDLRVLSLLQSSLESSILEAYSYCEHAKELWDTLKTVYGDVSSLHRVFEVKKAINELSQSGVEFNKHLGKFQSLWSELEMLRPNTLDPKVLLERREQDKVFGLLLTLDPMFNDLIKHVLREDKLPSMENICSRIHKEQGSFGLFGAKKELVLANKTEYKREDRSYSRREYQRCEHCKKEGHNKKNCWILNPHLKQRYPSFRAHTSQEASGANPRETAMNAQMDYVKRSDLEALLKAYASKESGINFSNPKPTSLIVDSGASHHMISNSHLLNNIKPAMGRVTIANGDAISIEGLGNLRLFEKDSQAFYVPKFTSNLLSVRKATKDLNCHAIFGPNDVHFQDIESGHLLGKGGTRDELYVLDSASSSSMLKNKLGSCFTANVDAMWHARLGHPHVRALELLLPNVYFDHANCEACILGKHCKTIFPKSSTIYENCFDLIHSDVWTAPCLTRDGNKYFVTFIDEKSKYTWVTLMPSKDRVFDAFVQFQSYVTNQFNAKIKIFRSDNGGEYTSNRFKEHLASHGILHQTSCPYTPQQNGVAERKNRHLMEVARSMMFHMNVPKRYWGDAVVAACYLINRIPTKILLDISPFEVLNHHKPSISHLRVFGCVCFVLIGEQKSKLDERSTRCIFLGYSTTQKGYKCYDPINNRVFVSRDVKFLEEKSYFENKDWEGLSDLSKAPSNLASSLRFLLEHLGNDPPLNRSNGTNPEANNDHTGAVSIDTNPVSIDTNNDVSAEVVPIGTPVDTVVDTHVSIDTPIDTPVEATLETAHNPVFESNDESDGEHELTMDPESYGADDEHGLTPSTSIPAMPLRRSTRPKFSSHVKDTKVYYNYQAVAHPTQLVCSLDLVPLEHQAFLGKIEEAYVPTTYEEAITKKEWVDAVQDERGAMERNHTWNVGYLPPGKKAVSSKWVFTIKYKSNGEIERYKARLVARGFTQTYGNDYNETFAPVAKLHTVRVVLSVATNLDWELWQMDVKNAFLQGELEDEVYMRPPPGLEDCVQPGQVLHLRKAIYGLKQSPRAWYHKLSMTLRDHGFKKSESDHTLFTLKSTRGLVVVLVYVDDLIITGDNKEGIQETKAHLKTAFDIKDLGHLHYFLGLEVCRNSDGLFLSQRKYTTDLLKETNSAEVKPAKTPLEDGYKVLRKGEKPELDELFEDSGLYRRIVGKLIYLTLTRPDLCFAVNQVSQHMQAPTVHHWNMIERILRYIKGTKDYGIWMGRNENTEIVGYCDADWAGDRNDRKSTTGYCTFVGGNLVTWKTKKQKVVSCSSAEAEYRAMRKLTSELTWLKALLSDLGIEKEEPITMHCDNQAAIHIATNPVFHERTKHIEIDCHKVREKIEEGVILPCYTKSEDQLADIFTKSASLKVCEHIISKLGLVGVQQS